MCRWRLPGPDFRPRRMPREAPCGPDFGPCRQVQSKTTRGAKLITLRGVLQGKRCVGVWVCKCLVRGGAGSRVLRFVAIGFPAQGRGIPDVTICGHWVSCAGPRASRLQRGRRPLRLCSDLPSLAFALVCRSVLGGWGGRVAFSADLRLLCSYSLCGLWKTGVIEGSLWPPG